MTTCAVCGAEVADDKIHHVHIKGKERNICKGCVTAIKGLA